MLVALVLCGLGTAWGQAPVNTTLWQETWTDGVTGTMPSNYGFEGTTVYGGATLTYAQSDINTKLYAETLAGGTSPELLLSKSNKTWTISNIPTGQATEMSLTFLSNKTTFAVTSSTKGITISGSQKSWTITATSGVTSFNLTIQNTGSANARIDNVALKVTTAGGETPKTEVSLSFPKTFYTTTVGETFTSPSLTVNPAAAASYVTYNSSNTDVATVGNDGSITLVGTGTTKITASISNNETYKDATTAYTLRVDPKPLAINPKSIGSNYFVKVTNLASLDDGDAIIFVNEDAAKAMSTTQNNNNRAATDVTIADDVINAPGADVQKVVLVKENNNFYFYTGTAGYLYAASSGSNFLRTTDAPDANAKAAVSFDEGNATIEFQGENTRNLLQYNSSSSLFSCYASGQNDVQIYKEVTPPVAQIGTQKYETLQAAVDAAQQLGGEQTINLLSDISGETVTIKEVANFKLTIDGQKDASSNYTVDAVIVVDGLRGNGGSTTNGASVTLQNIAFVKTTSTDGIQASHYPHHLTIQDCTYTGFDNDKWFLNASVDGPLYGVTVKNVTVEHARLIYANMADDAVFQNITATNDVKVGFNVKTSGTALIENCQITTGKYAFRDYTDGYEGTFTLKDNTFISTSEASDEGVIVNRGGAVGTGHINVESGTYTGHVKVLNNKEGVQGHRL